MEDDDGVVRTGRESISYHGFMDVWGWAERQRIHPDPCHIRKVQLNIDSLEPVSAQSDNGVVLVTIRFSCVRSSLGHLKLT